MNIYLGGFAEASFVRQLDGFFFLMAGSVVNYLGFPLAVLTLGFCPLYVFAYFILRRKSDISDIKTCVYGIITLLLTTILLCVFWVSAAVLGTWG